MADAREGTVKFLGTYFDRDRVLRMARVNGILGWITLGIYVFSAGISFTQFLIQLVSGVFFQKGMTVIDLLNFFTPYLLQLVPGLLYFAALKFVQYALLILLDIEENTRRVARI